MEYWNRIYTKKKRSLKYHSNSRNLALSLSSLSFLSFSTLVFSASRSIIIGHKERRERREPPTDVAKGSRDGWRAWPTAHCICVRCSGQKQVSTGIHAGIFHMIVSQVMHCQVIIFQFLDSQNLWWGNRRGLVEGRVWLRHFQPGSAICGNQQECYGCGKFLIVL